MVFIQFLLSTFRVSGILDDMDEWNVGFNGFDFQLVNRSIVCRIFAIQNGLTQFETLFLELYLLIPDHLVLGYNLKKVKYLEVILVFLN